MKNFKSGSQDEKEKASVELLELFNPIVMYVSHKLTKKFPHNIYETIPMVQNKLIMMIIEYGTPRTDTRANGLTKGSWAPNINVYIKQNLYYFTMQEIKKDIDSISREAENTTYSQPLNDVDDVVSDAEEEFNISDRISISEILDLVEDKFSSLERDVIMLKYVFGFKQKDILEITGLNGVRLTALLDKVKNSLEVLVFRI